MIERQRADAVGVSRKSHHPDQIIRSSLAGRAVAAEHEIDKDLLDDIQSVNRPIFLHHVACIHG